MARKGGQQQLQADIKTDEDLEKFISRPGFLILEVYSEWCGPCQGLLGTLRRIKLEIGGDNLHLAICKSDTVTPLKRFNKKSEPVWIFVTNGRAVGIYFGSDAPKLVNIVSRELEKTLSNASRPTYGIGELQPLEAEALRVKKEAIEKADRQERDKKYKKRLDYLNHCTDIIMENLPDIGVTVFGPQVSRDMFKKLAEPAEHLKMQCKDRKFIEVSTYDFDTVNYACKNPLSADVIEQLNGKELLICFWKIDESAGPIPHVLATYAHELTKERVAPPDEEHSAPHPIPPIIAPLKVKFEVEVEEGEVWVDDVSSEEEARARAAEKKALEKAKAGAQEDGRKDEGDDDGEEEASEEEEVVQAAQPAFPDMGFDLDLGLDDTMADGEEEVEEEEEEAPKALTRIKRVKIPPIWVANNRRTHAALIYVFFRNQTTGFLPPDPPPEPPHVIMAFEAYKRDDIMELVETIREDVPQYGFFTNDNPADAKLITNSIFKYDELPNTEFSDRMVLKVNKVLSYTMLSLVQFEPTYCSSNVDNGRLDALKFFPEEYKMDDEADAEKAQKKKKKVPKGGVAAQQPEEKVEEAAGEVAPAEEGEAEVPAAEGAAPDAAAGAAPAAESAPAPAEGEAPAEAAPPPPAPAEAPAPAESAPEPPKEEPAPAEAAEPPPADNPPPEAPPEPAPAE